MIDGFDKYLDEQIFMALSARNNNKKNNVMRDFWSGYAAALLDIKAYYNNKLEEEIKNIYKEALQNERQNQQNS